VHLRNRGVICKWIYRKVRLNRFSYTERIYRVFSIFLQKDNLDGKTILIMKNEILLSNLEVVPGREIIEHLGLVQGSTVRTKHVGRDIMASLKNIFGGELKGYTELLNDSRKEALERMVKQARAAGANGVLNIRFSTSSVAQGAAELFAYGTAVKLR